MDSHGGFVRAYRRRIDGQVGGAGRRNQLVECLPRRLVPVLVVRKVLACLTAAHPPKRFGQRNVQPHHEDVGRALQNVQERTIGDPGRFEHRGLAGFADESRQVRLVLPQGALLVRDEVLAAVPARQQVWLPLPPPVPK